MPLRLFALYLLIVCMGIVGTMLLMPQEMPASASCGEGCSVGRSSTGLSSERAARFASVFRE